MWTYLALFALAFVAPLHGDLAPIVFPETFAKTEGVEAHLEAHWKTVLQRADIVIHVTGPAGFTSTQRALANAHPTVNRRVAIITIGTPRFFHPSSCLEQTHFQAEAPDGGWRTHSDDPLYRAAKARKIWTLEKEAEQGELPTGAWVCFPPMVKAAQKVLEVVRAELVARFDLEPIGMTIRMMDRVRVLGFDFLLRALPNVESAQQMVVQCAEALICACNESDQIRPFLADLPFTAANIDLAISFLKADESRIYSPQPECVAVSRGSLDTFYVHPETGTYQRIDQEPFEVARRRLLG